MQRRLSLEFSQSDQRRDISLVVVNRAGQPLGGVRVRQYGKRSELELHRADQPEGVIGHRSRLCPVLTGGVPCTAEVLTSDFRLPGDPRLYVGALKRVLRAYMPNRAVRGWLPIQYK